MKKFPLFLFFITLSGLLAAQENSYMIYSFKGPVTVIENKVESSAKIGKMLTNTSTIKVGSNAVVTLICDQAAMFTLKKTGSYSLSKFTDSCAISNNSISSNYVKYVWSQMTHHEASPGSNRKAYMKNVGAVTRRVDNVWIDPKLDTVNYSGGEFPLSWKCYMEADEFDFSLYSSSNLAEPVFKKTVSKKKVSIPSFVTTLKPGNYFWTSAVKGEQNDDMKVFNYVTKETFENLLTGFKSEGPASETPAAQSYRVAFMLEDAHYLAEAYQYYQKAATADSSNSLYRFTLMSFKKDYEIK